MNITSESTPMTLTDFPDEILLLLFEEIGGVDALHSFYGHNHRLNRIVTDRYFVRRFTCVQRISGYFHSRIDSNVMLKRFCSEILPSIAEKIEQLHLESSTMKEIFAVTHYSNLSRLYLYNLTGESVQSLLMGKSSH